MLHCPLQIPVVCTPHERHWSPNYHHTRSPTLLQCTPPLFPLSRLTLQLAEHLRSNYKTAGQLYTVKLLTYKCSSTTSEWVARVRACNSIIFETWWNSLSRSRCCYSMWPCAMELHSLTLATHSYMYVLDYTYIYIYICICVCIYTCWHTEDECKDVYNDLCLYL